MKAFAAITGLALAATAGAAGARDEAAAASATFRPGWYVAPMAAWLRPDRARCGGAAGCSVDDGLGAVAALGHRGDFANLEIWGQYLTLPYDAAGASGDVQLNGGGLAMLVGPFSDDRVLARFFGIVGFGLLLRKDHPNYTQDDSTIFGDAGVGYLHPRLFGWDLGLRTELRYRYDVQQPPHPANQPHAYSDIVLHVGLHIPLSDVPAAPAPAPEPVRIVAAADADGDGVPDDRDQCPDTVAGTAVTETGCEPAAPAPLSLETARAGDTIILRGVNFETARATLTVNAERLLDGVAQQLNARPDLRVEIGGHTDDRGSDAYNQTLSEQRAQSVQAYLAGQGVAAERLSAVGYGESQPVAGNDTDEGRERNRRVELKVLEAPPGAAAPATE